MIKMGLLLWNAVALAAFMANWPLFVHHFLSYKRCTQFWFLIKRKCLFLLVSGIKKKGFGIMRGFYKFDSFKNLYYISIELRSIVFLQSSIICFFNFSCLSISGARFGGSSLLYYKLLWSKLRWPINI